MTEQAINPKTGKPKAVRDSKGRWPKGVTGNPKGRPPRQMEERVRVVIGEEMTDDDIRAIFRAALEGARNGDKIDREFIARYSWPKPTEFQEITVGQKPQITLEFPNVITPLELPTGTNDSDADFVDDSNASDA